MARFGDARRISRVSCSIDHRKYLGGHADSSVINIAFVQTGTTMSTIFLHGPNNCASEFFSVQPLNFNACATWALGSSYH